MKTKISIYELMILIIAIGAVFWVYTINSDYNSKVDYQDELKTSIEDIESEIQNHPNYEKLKQYGNKVFILNNLDKYKDSIAYADEYVVDLETFVLPKFSSVKSIKNSFDGKIEMTVSAASYKKVTETINELDKYEGLTNPTYGSIEQEQIVLPGEKIPSFLYTAVVVFKIDKEYLKSRYKEKREEKQLDLLSEQSPLDIVNDISIQDQTGSGSYNNN